MMILKLAFHFLAVRRLRLFAITVAFLGVTFCLARPPGTLLPIAFAFSAMIAYQFRSLYLEITSRNDYLHMLPVSCRMLYLSQLFAALAVGGVGMAAYWAVAKTGVLEAFSTEIIADHRYELFFFTDVAWTVFMTLVIYIAVIQLGHARTVSGWVSAPAMVIFVRQLGLPQMVEWAIPVAIAVSCVFALPSSRKPVRKQQASLMLGALICLPGIAGIFFVSAGTLNNVVEAILPIPNGLIWLPLVVYLVAAALVVYEDSLRRGMGRPVAVRWGLGALLLIGYPLIEIIHRVSSSTAFGKCRNCRRLRLHQLAACPFCGAVGDAVPVNSRRRGRFALVVGVVAVMVLLTTRQLTGNIPLIYRFSSKRNALQYQLNRVDLTVFSSPFFELDADQLAERHTWNRITLRPPRLADLDTSPEAFLETPYDNLGYGRDVTATFHVRGLVSGRRWSGPLKATKRFRTWSRVAGHTNVAVEIDIPDADRECQLFKKNLVEKTGLEAKVVYLCTLGPAAPYLVAISLADKPQEAETLLERYFELEYGVGDLSEFGVFRMAREVLKRGKLPYPLRLVDTVTLGLSITSKKSNRSVRIVSVRGDNFPLSGCRYPVVSPGPVALFAKSLVECGHTSALEHAYRREYLILPRELRMEVLAQLTAVTPQRAALFTRPSFQNVDSAMAIGRNADARVLMHLRDTYNKHLRKYEKVMAVFDAAEPQPGVVRTLSYSYGPLHFLAAALLATEKPECIALAAKSFPLELVNAAATEDSKPLELDLFDALDRCSEKMIRLFLQELPEVDWSSLNLEHYSHIRRVVESS